MRSLSETNRRHGGKQHKAYARNVHGFTNGVVTVARELVDRQPVCQDRGSSVSHLLVTVVAEELQQSSDPWCGLLRLASALLDPLSMTSPRFTATEAHSLL